MSIKLKKILENLLKAIFDGVIIGVTVIILMKIFGV